MKMIPKWISGSWKGEQCRTGVLQAEFSRHERAEVNALDAVRELEVGEHAL